MRKYIDYTAFVQESVDYINHSSLSRSMNISKETHIRDNRTCGFIAPRQSGKTEFILNWYNKHPGETLIIPKDTGTAEYIKKRLNNLGYEWHPSGLMGISPRPIDTITLNAGADSPCWRIKYILLEEASELFTYGRIKKKAFYKWIADNFIDDVIVICVG